MIGSLILLLPVLALQAGYITSFIVIIVSGIFSYFSCYLYLQHLGEEQDNGYAILKHFNTRGRRTLKVIYDVSVWFFLMLTNMQFFKLICLQWGALIPSLNHTIYSPLINAVILFILVFILKYFELSASLMAYGICTMVVYIIFLIWVLVTGNQGNSSQSYTAFGSENSWITLTSAMAQGFIIQVFLVPLLRKNNN